MSFNEYPGGGYDAGYGGGGYGGANDAYGGGGYGGGYGGEGDGYGYGGGAAPGGYFPGGADGGGEQQQKKGGSARGPVRPVTCRQIAELMVEEAESRFTLDGQELNHLVVIGQIQEVQQQATNFSYTINDSTAAIQVKVWNDPAESSFVQAQKAACTVGKYIRVVGKPTSFQGKRSVTGFSLRPLDDDMNFITYHLTHAALTTAQIQKGSTSSTSFKIGGAMKAEPIGSGGDLSKKVQDAIRALSGSEQGAAIQQVCAKVAAGADVVRPIVDQLMSEGILYTTVDEDHVRISM